LLLSGLGGGEKKKGRGNNSNQKLLENTKANPFFHLLETWGKKEKKKERREEGGKFGASAWNQERLPYSYGAMKEKEGRRENQHVVAHVERLLSSLPFFTPKYFHPVCPFGGRPGEKREERERGGGVMAIKSPIFWHSTFVLTTPSFQFAIIDHGGGKGEEREIFITHGKTDHIG